MMSDRRLKFLHSTIEDIMIVKLNDKIWSESERREIMESALKKFLRKRKKTFSGRRGLCRQKGCIQRRDSGHSDYEDEDDESDED